MPKYTHRAPTGGVDPSITLPISRGGTGATDAAGARTNLGALAASDLGVTYAKLNDQGKISTDQLPSVGAQQVMLVGPKLGTIGSALVYRITNFDSFRTYNVMIKPNTAATSITRDGDTITVATSANGETTAGFYVNGREISIPVS